VQGFYSITRASAETLADAEQQQKKKQSPGGQAIAILTSNKNQSTYTPFAKFVGDWVLRSRG